MNQLLTGRGCGRPRKRPVQNILIPEVILGVLYEAPVTMEELIKKVLLRGLRQECSKEKMGRLLDAMQVLGYPVCKKKIGLPRIHQAIWIYWYGTQPINKVDSQPTLSIKERILTEMVQK